LIDGVVVPKDKYSNINLLTFINARDRRGNTHLLRIAQNHVFISNYWDHNEGRITEFISQMHLKLIQLLIARDTEIDAVNRYG
jgi:hypothetical protein